MGITYFNNSKTFKLDTKKSTYMIAIVDKEQFIGHVYYGKRIEDEEMSYLLRIYEPPYIPTENNRIVVPSMIHFQQNILHMG